MQSLEAACEQTEHLLQTKSKIKLTTSSHVFNDKNDIQFISINQKLKDLYEEECAKDYSKPYKPTRSPSRLLSKLVVREGLSTLLVRLYPGDRGYSVTLGGCGGGSKKASAASSSGLGGGVTGVVLPYEQDELLHYIDQEELPPGLGDLLERATTPIFYGGCVIAEVHDMRHCPAGHTRFVLLRPTNQSLLCDINMITREGDWTPEERTVLESQLLQATQGPLCLDPSPSVSLAAIRARQQGLQINSASLRRRARKFSQVSVNKKRKLDQYASQCTTPLLDFIQQRKSKARNVPPSTKLPTKPSDVVPGALDPSTSLSIPDVSDVIRLARVFEPLRHTADCSPQLVEEYTLETERPHGRIYLIRLSVLQRPSSTEFLGELYVDRDYKEGVRNGSSCRFALGTRAHAIRYIQQFTEIFTEEGRKSVRITRIVPGEPSRVTFTGVLRERESAKANAVAAAQAQLANQAAAQAAAQVAAQAAAQAAAAQAVGQLTPVVVSVSVAPATPVAVSATTNGLPLAVTSQQQQQPSLMPVLHTQNSQQSLSIANSTLLAQQLQQSPIASTHMMQTSPVTASLPTSPVKTSSGSPTRHTDPAFSALVTSLMNSAQQFQQSIAMNNSVAVNANLNPLLQQNQQQPQKIIGRKIAVNNNLLSSRLSAPIQTVPIAPLPLQMNASATSTTCVSPSLAPLLAQQSPLLAQQSPQPVQMSALTSQLNAPPVIAPGQACFSLPNANNSYPYTIPNKIISSNHTVRLPVATNVQTDNSGNRRQNSAISEQLSSNLGNSMPGLSALLAGTSATDNPIPGMNANCTLLERLTASSVTPQYVATATGPGTSAVPVSSPSPKPIIPSPMSSPSHQTSALSLSNLNLKVASLQGALAALPGMQNVQVTIPLPSPIALSLNVSTPVSGQQTGVIVTTLPLGNTNTVTCPSGINSMVSNLTPAQSPSPIAPIGNSPTNHTMLLANSVGVAASSTGQMLSLPVAQVVASGMKTALNQTQGMRTSSNSVVIPQLAPGPHNQQQSIQLVGTLRGSPVGQVLAQATASRGLVQRQGTSLKVTASQPTAGNIQSTMTSSSSPIVTLTPQQQLQFALQKHPQRQQCLQQKSGLPGAATLNTKPRRSSTAEPK